MTQFLIPPPPGDPSQTPDRDESASAPVTSPQHHQIDLPPVSTGNRLVPILLVLLLIGGACAWFTVRTANAGAWHEDVYAALDVAEEEGRPVFVLFTADWCPPCQRLRSETLAHGRVLEELEQFVLVKVDVTDDGSEQAAVAASLDVSSIPAMHVYDAEGNRLARRTGYIDPGGALAWLQDARSSR